MERPRQVAAVTHPLTVPSDVHDVAVVEQPIQGACQIFRV